MGADNPVFTRDEPKSIRSYLNGDSLISIPHIVLRGTYLPDTVRCTSGNLYRLPSYEDPASLYAHSLLYKCYADVRVNAYTVGSGPPQLTVQVYFHHYYPDPQVVQTIQSIGFPDVDTLQEAEEWFVAGYQVWLTEGEDRSGEGIQGREAVFFLGPSHDVGGEAWQVFRTWGVETRKDGTVVAVHPHRDDYRALRPDVYQSRQDSLEMTLSAFTQAVTTAHKARVAEYGGRVASEDIPGRAAGVDLPMLVTDANQLESYFREVGAYDDPDNPPAQPPPPAEPPPTGPPPS